ncbi:MAG: energy-coupling factor transporter transmembrane component T [Eubacteriales bacterium]|nr:energy-coupling factor transporter transmembrane component T [Eubacteriales bacterium]
MKNRFIEYHPIAGFVYFTVVLLISMFSMHPIIIAISLVMGVINCIILKGARAAGKTIRYMAVMAFMIIIINPLFNHQGITVLFYMSNGNPVTMEAIIYGGFMSAMLVSVIVWFNCYNEVMTTDKFIYLFGKISPHFSLVISMTFRFVPRFIGQFGQIRDAQKAIGKDAGDGKIFEKIRHFANEVSIMISWAMENSIETADSMKARGYGLGNRTAFSVYRFNKRDAVVLIMTGFAASGYVVVTSLGGLYFTYYPAVYGSLFSLKAIAAYAVFTALCSIPIAVNIKE